MDGVQLHVRRRGEHVLVSVRPPAEGQRQPVSVCCALDILHPNKDAPMPKAGVEEDHRGFTVLDVAKHSIRTVVHTLKEQDRFSLVAFQCGELYLLPPTTMDSNGQQVALQKLDALTGEAAGDTWETLQHALEVLRCDTKPGQFNHVMLMTDAPFDSVHRPKVIPSLEEYMTKHGSLPGSINTLGFGYQIDGKLLPRIASIGSGSHSFIPDVGFVGTACVHLLANLLVTMASQVQLDFSVQNGAQLLDENQSVICGYPLVKDGSLFSLNLGSLQLGQTKDVILKMKSEDTDGLKSCLTISCRCMTNNGECVQLSAASMQDNVPTDEDASEIEFHRCRRLVIEALPAAAQRELHENLQKAQESIKELGEALSASHLSSSDDRLKALIEDIVGQTTEAFSCSEWYDKWGFRYMPSLLSAHKLQQCNNFKDLGVQKYGGDVFLSILDEADDTFNSLPALTSSKPAVPVVSPARTTAYAPPAPSPARSVVTMAAYNDRYGG